MSTGNPHEPGAGGQWPADARNLSAPDEHGGGGGVNPEAIRAGHEPDAFAVRPIFSIPGAVVITFIIASIVAIAAFTYLMNVPKDPLANPQAVEQNSAPLNDRLDRLGRATPSEQPRLEPLQRLENNGQTIPQSPLPGGVRAGNSPELHPEDLRPTRIADPKDPNAANWTEKDRQFAGKIVEATKTAGENDQVRSALFPVRKDQVKPPDTSRMPSEASAGRGTVPAAPHDDHAGHDHGKKEPDKKETAPMPKAPEKK
jgi:hypothetical protein